MTLASLLLVIDVGAQEDAPANRKRPILKAKILHSSDAEVSRALVVFQKSARLREKVSRIKMEYLYRSIPIHKQKLGAPNYVVGRLIEDYAKSEYLIDSLKMVPRKDNESQGKPLPQKARPDEFGQDAKLRKAPSARAKKEWKKELSKLQEFVTAQHYKDDFEPTDLEMSPISPFFDQKQFQPGRGGVFLSTSEVSFQWKKGSRIGYLDPPGSEAPDWVHYFDPRAFGFSSRREVKLGATLEETMRRYNTGNPFSVEQFNGMPYVSVLFSKGASRFLLAEDHGFLPAYSANFRGELRDGDKALLVQKPKIQTWIKPIKVNGVWVPRLVRVLDDDALIDIELKWHGVNLAFDNAPFSVDSIPLPARTRIDDRRELSPSD